MVHREEISVSTKGHGDMHDLTEKVSAIVAASGIRNGTVNAFNVGSTAAVGTIEFEPGLQQDLPSILDKLIPPSRSYGHEQAWHDGNGHSHLQATLLGPSLTVPVRTASRSLAPGSRFSIWNATCAAASAPSSSPWPASRSGCASASRGCATRRPHSSGAKEGPIRKPPRRAACEGVDWCRVNGRTYGESSPRVPTGRCPAGPACPAPELDPGWVCHGRSHRQSQALYRKSHRSS